VSRSIKGSSAGKSACKTCGYPKHKGICDMATLDNGRIVHASRIKDGLVDGVRVKNRWIKPPAEKKIKARRS
jgi:hypothetical protein